ncbi:MAG: glutamate synthase subunit beta [Desulforhopalus sp.]|nr:glutamate synthase subunit beta [Desulforhopalus sp.]
MQEFIDSPRRSKQKRTPETRLKDYNEIYNAFDVETATTQSKRCVQCGDPQCLFACPLHNYVPFWLRNIAAHDWDLAFQLSNETNPFPEITGRICPQDRLCEGACILKDEYGAVSIGTIEQFITEEGFKHGAKLPVAEKMTDKRVAVVGSGPTGISVATFLLRAGIQVDMYEKQGHPGGLLTFGIPNFKLEKKVVFNRFELLKKAGLNLFLNTELGKDVLYEKLEQEYDAIFLGIGAEQSRAAHIHGELAENSFKAIDFLRNMQLQMFAESFDTTYDVKGKDVIVIGGGDTAMDCIRTSLREKAARVRCLYRRDSANMPGSKKEFQNAMEEGAEFLFNASPKKLVDKENRATAIIAEKTVLTAKDASGRQSVKIVEGSDFTLDADVFIFALGFSPKSPEFLQTYGIETDDRNRIVIDKNFRTTRKNVWAGGDISRGADLVVTAAADGREAAKDIIATLLP